VGLGYDEGRNTGGEGFFWELLSHCLNAGFWELPSHCLNAGKTSEILAIN